MKNKSMKRKAMLLSMLLLATACGSPSQTGKTPSNGSPSQSEKTPSDASPSQTGKQVDNEVPLQIATVNLMKDLVKSENVQVTKMDAGDAENAKAKELTDFSLKVLGELDTTNNTMISPVSIASALAMTANGAEKDTLKQMEQVLGADVGHLNNFLCSYRMNLPTSDKYKVSLANSIWFRHEPALNVKKEFLQKNKDYYDAEVYEAAFDEGTKNDINNWVSEKTEKQIDRLLEEPPARETIMYLINALSFDGEWQEIYQEIQIRDGEFTKADKEKQTVPFMFSEEGSYISLPNATGFSKPYADGKYSFAALLPKEGVSTPDFIASLDGKSLIEAMENATSEKVMASIPKFTFSYDILLNDSLQKLGMTDAFLGDKAAFSDMATYEGENIYIDKVIHKTKITVDEKGTKAGAVTAVMMTRTTGLLVENPKVVNLDRPFVFLIVDQEYHFPLFLGVLNEVSN